MERHRAGHADTHAHRRATTTVVKPLDKAALRIDFGWLHDAQLLQDQPDTLTVSVVTDGSPVKVSFFGGIDIGWYFDPGITDE